MNLIEETDSERYPPAWQGGACPSPPHPGQSSPALAITHDATLKATNPVRDLFWFDDCDILLEVERHQFKVHRLGLSCSDIFTDMFALSGQPSDEDCVDGVPIVQLPDSALDWTTVLGWIYDYK